MSSPLPSVSVGLAVKLMMGSSVGVPKRFTLDISDMISRLAAENGPSPLPSEGVGLGLAVKLGNNSMPVVVLGLMVMIGDRALRLVVGSIVPSADTELTLGSLAKVRPGDELD
jgi:hypothetical protein